MESTSIELKTTPPNFQDAIDRLKNNAPISEDDRLVKPDNFGAWFEVDYDGD